MSKECIYKEELGKLLPLPEVDKPNSEEHHYWKFGNSYTDTAFFDKEKFDKDLAAYNSWLDSGIIVSPELKLKDGGVYAFFEHVDYLLLVDKKALSTNLDWVITNKGNIYAPNQGLVFKSGITCDKIVAYKPLHKNADRLEGLPLLAVPLPQASNETNSQNIFMKSNEIKKELYKQKPVAQLEFIRKGIAYYVAVLNNEYLRFEVPISDMGDADFTPHMEAKLLIRYLTINS
jgi:hypothetical protein